MVRVNIENDAREVVITCPHCEHCESLPIDEQRHHLQTIELMEWRATEEELSLMKCLQCEGYFELTWNYLDTNEIED